MTFPEFQQALQAKGLTVSDNQIEQLRVYAALLKRWNERMNLTSILEEPDVIEKHFYDSALPACYLSLSDKSIADIGSGAGFPGMVFAILVPDCQVTLIDSTMKKFAFLEEVRKQLNLNNVHFRLGRVEEMKEERGTFDCVSARGFAAMRVFVEVGAPLAKVGGILIAMKGAKGKEELCESENIMKKIGVRVSDKHEDVLPNGDIRLNYFLKKMNSTPSRYPRRWSEIIAK